MAPMTDRGTAVVTPGTTEQFLELVCADDDLVRAEFDAIIAAEFASPPVHPVADAPGARPRRHRNRSRRVGSRPLRDDRKAGVGGWTRQRSPPRRSPRHR